MKYTSICRLKNHPEYRVIVNMYIQDDNEFDVGEFKFEHILTGSECETPSSVLQGWEEQDPKEQKLWKSLIKYIEQDDILDQKVIYPKKVIEY